MSIIAWLIVGAIAGWIAGKVVPGDEGYGVLGTIIPEPGTAALLALAMFGLVGSHRRR